MLWGFTRDVYFTLLPHPGGGGIRMALEWGVAQEWKSEAEEILRLSDNIKKMNVWGRRLGILYDPVVYYIWRWEAKGWGVWRAENHSDTNLILFPILVPQTCMEDCHNRICGIIIMKTSKGAYKKLPHHKNVAWEL